MILEGIELLRDDVLPDNWLLLFGTIVQVGIYLRAFDLGLDAGVLLAHRVSEHVHVACVGREIMMGMLRGTVRAVDDDLNILLNLDVYALLLAGIL